MSVRGRLIVFEGGEGVGKSTQAELLAEHLSAVLTREPGGTATGERVRSILLDPTLGDLDARAELLLMVAARAQHVAERIRPALFDGHDVVCDRFSGSTLAYQGYGRGLPLDEVRAACALAQGGLDADLTILLDGLSEAQPAGGRDRIEAEDREFHERVRAGFRALADSDPTRWAVIDSSGTREQIAFLVRGVVAERLGTVRT